MASPSVLASAAGAAPAVMLAAVLAAACAAVLTRLLVSAGHRAGALDSAGASGHSKDLRRVPNVGGIAIVATVALPLVAILLIDRLVGAEELARRLAESERLDALVPSALRLPRPPRRRSGSCWERWRCTPWAWSTTAARSGRGRSSWRRSRSPRAQ